MHGSRQFPPEVTRMGNLPVKATFAVRCSECGKRDAYESRKKLPDQIVYKRFATAGWLLGKRSRDHDICPECLGIGAANKLAGTFKVTENRQPALAAEAVVEIIQEERMAAADRVIAALNPAGEAAAVETTPAAKPVTVPKDDAVAALERRVIQMMMMLSKLSLKVDKLAAREAAPACDPPADPYEVPYRADAVTYRPKFGAPSTRITIPVAGFAAAGFKRGDTFRCAWRGNDLVISRDRDGSMLYRMSGRSAVFRGSDLGHVLFTGRPFTVETGAASVIVINAGKRP